MTNLEKYNKAFCDSFEITEEKLVGLQYQQIELWDSVGHMTLVANLEDAFDITIDDEDLHKFRTVGDVVKYLEETKG